MKIAILILCGATVMSCSNVEESIYDEYIDRPGADIEAELPQWEETTKEENDIIFDINK